MFKKVGNRSFLLYVYAIVSVRLFIVRHAMVCCETELSRCLSTFGGLRSALALLVFLIFLADDAKAAFSLHESTRRAAELERRSHFESSRRLDESDGS